MNSDLLVLNLLGRAQLFRHGASIAEALHTKALALLAYLALEERPISRDQLSDLLWPDLPRDAARANLRKTVFRLRESIPRAEFLVATADSLALVAGHYRLDVARFSAPATAADPPDELERRLALYRGPLLDGLALDDAPGFEEWLLQRRQQLHQQALGLSERLADLFERDGDAHRALDAALRRLELDPWDESAHRQAMRLYAATAQQAAALLQYERCCRVLAAELGVKPSGATTELAERIRRGEFSAPPAAPTPARGRSELRQTTVLHCALLLPGSHDPEEGMAHMLRARALCADTLRRYSGHVVQAQGGGLLAYFGYPRAIEHAARHAVFAGLAMVQESAAPVEIRIGIHTGLIITGPEPSLPDPLGDISRIASQISLEAGPNGVAVSSDTRGLLAGFFDCTRLESRALPGIASPPAAWLVTGESGAATRVDAAERLTPLVGRQRELAQIMAAWEAAARGACRMLLIQGEAGMGKTRLAHTVNTRLTGTPHLLRILRCFPESSHSPLHPVIAMLENLFGFIHGESEANRLQRLSAHLIANYPDMPDALPLLARLLSLPGGEALQLSPKQLKERTNALLLTLLRTLASRLPLLLVVEDLHWSDPSTLELISLFIAGEQDAPVLVLMTARPEFTPPWPAGTVDTLTLGPLGDDDMAALVASVGDALPPPTSRRIIERADGIPLFAEEMAKFAAESRATGIPATLLDLLTARIDRTGEAKRTAQLAATLGREFGAEFLGHIATDVAPHTLAQHLERLREAGLILETETGYQFKHSLICEAAYHSQTRADRQLAHGRIAAALRGEFAEVAAACPELLARHLQAGGDSAAAMGQWVVAGTHAAQRFANLEAASHFRAALGLLLATPPGQERDQTEFRILVSLSPVLHAILGYGAKEAQEVNARIAQLMECVGEHPGLFPAKWLVTLNMVVMGATPKVPALVEQLLRMAGDDPEKQLAALYHGVNCNFWMGEFEKAQAFYDRLKPLRPFQRSESHLRNYGMDLCLIADTYAMGLAFFFGYPEQAEAMCARLIDEVRALAHPTTSARALSAFALLYRWMRKPEPAAALAAETLVVSTRYDLPLWVNAARLLHGWAIAAMGDHDAAVKEAEQGTAGMRTIFGGLAVMVLSSLGEVYALTGRYPDALATIDRTIGTTSNTGDRHFTAELHRQRGECLLAIAPDDTAEPEALFQKALAISRDQHARMWELRAATSLARLRARQGRREEARALLAGVYGGFTEGFLMPDLREAAELLAMLDQGGPL